MASPWSRYDAPDLAVERILDGAEKAFVELGVSRAGMSQIARFAGCSRGTLYRYFKTRHQLHAAYIERATLEIERCIRAALSGVEDPRQRLVEGISRAVREVRRRPGTLAWFEPGISGTAARMSRSSEAIETISTAFVRQLLGSRRRSADSRVRARWLLRIVVSLLSNPAESAAEERAILERFVAPGLLAEDQD
jgi:AcrR family transcriptional regulator